MIFSNKNQDIIKIIYHNLRVNKMEYRIKKDENGYIAEIGKENKFGKLNWINIENDNDYLCDRRCYYETIEEAEIACKKHHTDNGYDKIGKDIVKTFTL